MKKKDEDDSSSMLKKILSPADAQSLVKPPPDHPPHSGPGVSTPLTGNLTAPPSMTKPSRQGGLAGYIANQSGPGKAAPADPSGDPAYVKVVSFGQVGYLPRVNLMRAQQIDPQLKILE